MTLKTKFILLSLSLAAGLLVLGSLAVTRYHSRIPLINRLFYTHPRATNSETPIYPYTGLKPEPNDPNGIYYKDRVIVLMYHDISPKPDDLKSLSVANFDKQLELMRDNNFHWITMNQYRNFILHSSPIPVNAVLLTFDDGYESLYKYAFPVLEKYHAPSASFLIVNTVGNPQHNGVPKLTWEQVELMHKNGIDFFSHTYDSHMYVPTGPSNKKQLPMLASQIYLKDKKRKETEQEYEQRVTSDLKKANDILFQKLGAPNHVLAFPFGAFSKPLLKICNQLGIDITLTVKSGLNKAGQTNGFRVNAGGMTNDPVLQMSLMKQALNRLGNNHFGKPSVPHHFILLTLLVLLILGVFWLWVGWKLFGEKMRRKIGGIAP
ncbi:polysaccharide deacetylase family protein [Cohnella silvisoli]|uniref:Polysaccharide deacetylase family protein n=1 Tax=Cohnella silvisoli TaxID=2873699 RepID=A0ABV1KU02_9BACL|nr:polysaccharide deacetylase family protein [Cohnella silvisoli]MCD9023224.1 polysaccharide deacetylase family protein [Cohnella silvisoli]